MENIKVILSKKFSLLGRDYLRGLGMAILTAVLVVIQRAVDAVVTGADFTINLQALGMAAVGAGIGYLIKNGLFEPTKVITEVPKESANPVAVTAEIKNLVS